MNVNEMNWELVHFLLSQKEKSTALSVWGCRGWQAARTWVLVSPETVGFPAPIGLLEPANQQAPKREQREHEGKRKSS